LTGPALTAKNVELVFSDSGKVQAKLTSVLLNQYSTPNSYMEFPKGFKVVMFDSAMRVETTIYADYGKRMDNTRIMLAKGNVVVRNEIKKEQLNTEQLTWDEPRKMIFSQVPVKITTPDKTLYGDGLESNESFTRYHFMNVHGLMLVKKDSI
jgi:LPS export ABC transporter protein LptC